MPDVHTEHCCLRHGCKYGITVDEKDCTVVSGKEPQSYPCEICNVRPDLPHVVVLKLMQKLIKFPYAQVCKHAAALDLLSALEAEGMPIPEALAEAMVNAEDEACMELLEKEIKDAEKLAWVDWAAYGGV